MFFCLVFSFSFFSFVLFRSDLYKYWCFIVSWLERKTSEEEITCICSSWEFWFVNQSTHVNQIALLTGQLLYEISFICRTVSMVVKLKKYIFNNRLFMVPCLIRTQSVYKDMTYNTELNAQFVCVCVCAKPTFYRVLFIYI